MFFAWWIAAKPIIVDGLKVLERYLDRLFGREL